MAPTRGASWQAYSALPDGSDPAAVVAWQGSFALVGYDAELDQSTLFQFDPESESLTPLSTLDGFVGAVVADASYMYARADDAVGGSSLRYSSDGAVWQAIDLDSKRA